MALYKVDSDTADLTKVAGGTPQGYVYFDGDSVTTVNTTIYIDLANNEVKLKSLHSGAYFNVQWAILEYTKTTD